MVLDLDHEGGAAGRKATENGPLTVIVGLEFLDIQQVADLFTKVQRDAAVTRAGRTTANPDDLT